MSRVVAVFSLLMSLSSPLFAAENLTVNPAVSTAITSPLYAEQAEALQAEAAARGATLSVASVKETESKANTLVEFSLLAKLKSGELQPAGSLVLVLEDGKATEAYQIALSEKGGQELPAEIGVVIFHPQFFTRLAAVAKDFEANEREVLIKNFSTLDLGFASFAFVSLSHGSITANILPDLSIDGVWFTPPAATPAAVGVSNKADSKKAKAAF